MLKIFIDGKHFQDQLRQCKVKEGQVFNLKLSKVAHDRLGQWDVYFESLSAASQEVFKRIENISEVIDWEEDIGERREMKETDYQALKKELGCV